MHVLMRDERRKEERSKQGQTNNKAKQHSTPKAVTLCIYLLDTVIRLNQGIHVRAYTCMHM